MNVGSNYAAFAEQIFDDELILQCRDVFSNDQRLKHLQRVFLEEVRTTRNVILITVEQWLFFVVYNGTIGHLRNTS
jgi:hypothetical protein